MNKTYGTFLTIVMLIVTAVVFSGCTVEVPPGTYGRINTPDGWSDSILKTGRHSCYGRDSMYFLDITQGTYTETMRILVGGKVNLTVDISVRTRVNTEDTNGLKNAFEAVTAEGKVIQLEKLYNTFLKMKTLAIPRALFEVQPDVQTAVNNSPQIAAEARKQIMEMAKSTPLIVEDFEITNYDWPNSITDEQEKLVKIQLQEAAAEAQVRADLKHAEGQLAVEEAKKLVEMKKAEAVAASIDIIKKKLADSPEYLMWHQIRVMGEAAAGPNNAFILYPYNTDSNQIKALMGNASLSQMLKAKGYEDKAVKSSPSEPAEKTPDKK